MQEIETGSTVITTHEVPNARAGRPALPSGLIGQVRSINSALASIEVDPDDLPDGINYDPRRGLLVPLAALALTEQPVDITADWDMIALLQRGSEDVTVAPHYSPSMLPMITFALGYDPRRNNGLGA